MVAQFQCKREKQNKEMDTINQKNKVYTVNSCDSYMNSIQFISVPIMIHNNPRSCLSAQQVPLLCTSVLLLKSNLENRTFTCNGIFLHRCIAILYLDKRCEYFFHHCSCTHFKSCHQNEPGDGERRQPLLNHLFLKLMVQNVTVIQQYAILLIG